MHLCSYVLLNVTGESCIPLPLCPCYVLHWQWKVVASATQPVNLENEYLLTHRVRSLGLLEPGTSRFTAIPFRDRCTIPLLPRITYLEKCMLQTLNICAVNIKIKSQSLHAFARSSQELSQTQVGTRNRTPH